MNYIPRFILATNRERSLVYIVHTQSPMFIVEVLSFKDIETSEKYAVMSSNITKTVNIFGMFYIFEIVKTADNYNEFEVEKIISRLTDWYKSVIIETTKNEQKN